MSYSLVRCAGLYEGVTGYIGTERLGPAATKQQSDSVIFLSLSAVRIRSKTRGGKPDDYVDEVLSDRHRIAKVYHERMTKNYAASGQAIYDDPRRIRWRSERQKANYKNDVLHFARSVVPHNAPSEHV